MMQSDGIWSLEVFIIIMQLKGLISSYKPVLFVCLFVMLMWK